MRRSNEWTVRIPTSWRQPTGSQSETRHPYTYEAGGTERRERSRAGTPRESSRPGRMPLHSTHESVADPTSSEQGTCVAAPGGGGVSPTWGVRLCRRTLSNSLQRIRPCLRGMCPLLDSQGTIAWLKDSAGPNCRVRGAANRLIGRSGFQGRLAGRSARAQRRDNHSLRIDDSAVSLQGQGDCDRMFFDRLCGDPCACRQGSSYHCDYL